MNKKIIVAFLLSATIIPNLSTYANGPMMNINTSAKSPIVEPESNLKEMYPGNQISTYKVDQDIIKRLYNEGKNSKLYKVVYDNRAILNKYGINGEMSEKITSISLTENQFSTTIDLANGMISGWRNNQNYTIQSGLTKSGAIMLAENFIKEQKLKDNISGKFGNPIVSTNDMMRPMMNTKGEMTDDNIENDIPTTSDDLTNINIEKTYESLSITYPLIISGRKVVTAYGQIVGIRIDIANGLVSGFSVSPISFKLIRRNSEKLTTTDLISFIEKGGNSPYYGTAKSVDFDTTERAWILHTGFINGSNQTFLSSGFYLEDSKASLWGNQNYIQSVSDYKIINTNY